MCSWAGKKIISPLDKIDVARVSHRLCSPGSRLLWFSVPRHVAIDLTELPGVQNPSLSTNEEHKQSRENCPSDLLSTLAPSRFWSPSSKSLMDCSLRVCLTFLITNPTPNSHVLVEQWNWQPQEWDVCVYKGQSFLRDWLENQECTPGRGQNNHKPCHLQSKMQKSTSFTSPAHTLPYYNRETSAPAHWGERGRESVVLRSLYNFHHPDSYLVEQQAFTGRVLVFTLLIS